MNRYSPLLTIITVFFFWGFVAASNGIFIPFSKMYFNLTQFESQLIDFAFYAAYFIGSLILYLLSVGGKFDLLNRIGYRNGIILGLLISTTGVLLMIPSLKYEEHRPLSTCINHLKNLQDGGRFSVTGHSVSFENRNDSLLLVADLLKGGNEVVTSQNISSCLLSDFNIYTHRENVKTALIDKKQGYKLLRLLEQKFHYTVTYGKFIYILFSLFVIALGFSLQQTAAQPFVIALGSQETGSHRLNLAGGVNSLGTLISPLVVSFLLFGSSTSSGQNATPSNITILFSGLAVIFIISCVLLYLTKLPSTQISEVTQSQSGALKYPQVRWGMAAIFVYVGVEVSIQSNMGELLRQKEYGGLLASEISPYISLYWGSLMIGRWAGALDVFKLSKKNHRIFLLIVPIIAFTLIMLVNQMKGNSPDFFIPYLPVLLILWLGFYFSESNPVKTLSIFSLLGIIAMAAGFLLEPNYAIYAFISGGLWCSVLWPCIFSLGIMNVGNSSGQGAALMIMMILGGAIIPPLQGILADKQGVLFSYIIPALCFAFLYAAAWRFKRIHAT